MPYAIVGVPVRIFHPRCGCLNVAALGCLNVAALGCLNVAALGCLNVVALDCLNASVRHCLFACVVPLSQMLYVKCLCVCCPVISDVVC